MSRAGRTTLRGVLDLLRISNLPTIWTNVLAGALLSCAKLEASSFLLLGVAISAFYLGGMALNDLWDRRWDEQHRPCRPIPSARVSLAAARRISVALLLLPFLLLPWASSLAGMGAAVLLLLSIVAYDRFHRQTPWAALLMALCRLLSYVVPALALTRGIGPDVLLAGGLQFLYVLTLSLVARRVQGSTRPAIRGLVPWMISGICLLDGAILACFRTPLFILLGMAAALLTRLAQLLVPGD